MTHRNNLLVCLRYFFMEWMAFGISSVTRSTTRFLKPGEESTGSASDELF